MQERYLISGGNGFLGRYLVCAAHDAGNSVFSLQRKSQPIEHAIIVAGDITQPLDFGSNSFDVVVHSAGKAHSVPKTAEEKQAFHDINAGGTQNLLSALEELPSLPRQFVFISTVAVYGRETGEAISESQPLAATEPYGKSKIEAEEMVRAWGEKNAVPVVILRLPLVVGQNPPGNLQSLLGALRRGRYRRIGDGSARKSMVLADDVARLVVGLRATHGTYNLSDGVHPSFAELEDAICGAWKLPAVKGVALGKARAIASVGTGLRRVGVPFPLHTRTLEKIINPLTFDDGKARRELNWQPRAVLENIHELTGNYAE
ncbi:MAG TPA: NAD-dependent epimerase/dehydratase family protein [Abditibacteriaceae bacterium]|jgi:nucleoside-diphosphate-sugar epimerase